MELEKYMYDVSTREQEHGRSLRGEVRGLSPPPKPLIMDNIFFSKQNQHTALTIYRDT